MGGGTTTGSSSAKNNRPRSNSYASHDGSTTSSKASSTCSTSKNGTTRRSSKQRRTSSSSSGSFSGAVTTSSSSSTRTSSSSSSSSSISISNRNDSTTTSIIDHSILASTSTDGTDSNDIPPQETVWYDGQELMIVPPWCVAPLGLGKVPPSEVLVTGEVIMAWHPSHSSQRRREGGGAAVGAAAGAPSSIFSTIPETATTTTTTRQQHNHRKQNQNQNQNPQQQRQRRNGNKRGNQNYGVYLTRFFSSVWGEEDETEPSEEGRSSAAALASSPALQPSSPSSISSSSSPSNTRKKRNSSHNHKKQRAGAFASSSSSFKSRTRKNKFSTMSSSQRIQTFVMTNITAICLGILGALLGILMLALYLDSDTPVGYNRHDPSKHSRAGWVQHPQQTYNTNNNNNQNRKKNTSTNRKAKPTASPTRSSNKNNNSGQQKSPPVKNDSKILNLVDDMTMQNTMHLPTEIRNSRGDTNSMDAVFDPKRQFLAILDLDSSPREQSEGISPTPFRYGLDEEATSAFETIIRRARESGGEIKTFANARNTLSTDPTKQPQYVQYVDKNTNQTVTKLKGRGGGEEFIISVQPGRGVDFKMYNDEADSHEILLCKKPIPPRRSSNAKYMQEDYRLMKARVAAAAAAVAAKSKKKKEEEDEANAAAAAAAAAVANDDDLFSSLIATTDIHAPVAYDSTKAAAAHNKIYEKKGGACIAGSLGRQKTPTAEDQQAMCQQQQQQQQQGTLTLTATTNDKQTVMIPNSPYEALPYIPPHRFGEQIATADATASFTEMMTTRLMTNQEGGIVTLKL